MSASAESHAPSHPPWTIKRFVALSNAAVASMLGTPAVIVSEGGVGRPIDEIVLNAALFERQGVKVAGAIVNKVDLDAQPGIGSVLKRGLEHDHRIGR